jgi:hypothetical protein
MECPECNREMRGCGGTDSGSSEIEVRGKECGIAFNVGICDDCYIVARENVWDFKGTVYIYPDTLPAACDAEIEQR